MKKVLTVLFALAGGLWAQDTDTLVKNAVDSLVAGRTAAVEVSVSPVSVGDTQAVSELSAYLDGKIRLFASHNGLYKLVPETRGLVIQASSKAVLTGVYNLKGKSVTVELCLEAEIDGKKLKTARFSLGAPELAAMGIQVLPDNYKAQKDVETEEAIFANVEAGNPFVIKVFGNSENRVYHDGDKLRLTLLAEKDCFFKVYHIDVHNNMKLVYPNSLDRDNALRAGRERVIPDKTEFVMEAPYGQETILVVANETQIENMDSEILNVVKLDKNTIQQAAGRGLAVQAKAGPDTASNASVRYSYTVLDNKPVAETVHYPKPADPSGFLQTIKSGVLARGGTFTGNEKEGTFSQDGLNGSYKVTAKEIIISFEDGETAGTRGMAVFNFAFSKPGDINRSLKSVQSEISKNAGTFNGNESEGSFAVQGIAGTYRVADTVNVSIYEKPWVIPNSLIEKEVKNYFLGK